MSLQDDLNAILEIPPAGGTPPEPPEPPVVEVPAVPPEPPATPAPPTEPPVEPPPEPPIPPVEPPVEPPPVVTPPGTPPGDPPGTPPADDTVAQLTAQLEEYRALIANMQGLGGTPPAGSAPPAAPVPGAAPVQGQPPQTPTPAGAPATTPEPIKFFGSEEEMDEAFKTHESMNSFLNTAFGKFVEQFGPTVVQRAVERSMMEVPTLTRDVVRTQVAMHTLVTEFWANNTDLRAHSDYTGMVANRITAEHPDYALPKVLEETEKEVRTKLRIPKVGGGTPGPVHPGPSQPPAFVPPGGARGVATPTQLTALEREVNDLVDI